jgi:hypothetical protein
VEQITQEMAFPVSEKGASRLIIPLYLWIVPFMVVGFAIVNIGVSGLAHKPFLPVNPFAEYVDVFPGQPKSAIEARGFSCQEPVYNYGNASLEEYCDWNPESGVFSSVAVMIYQQVVHQISFTLRDNRLRVGDMATWLEKSDVKVYRDTVYFTLPDSLVIAKTRANARHFSLFRPVWQVSFSDPDQSTEQWCIISDQQQVCSDDKINTRPG